MADAYEQVYTGIIAHDTLEARRLRISAAAAR
jgi:hypothetical protein